MIMISLLSSRDISTTLPSIFCSELGFLKLAGPFFSLQAVLRLPSQDANTKQGGSEILELYLNSAESKCITQC